MRDLFALRFLLLSNSADVFQSSKRGDVSYALPYGEWIRLFRRHGLVVDDLIELQPPADATTTYTFLGREWARRWPGEQIWVVSKPRP